MSNLIYTSSGSTVTIDYDEIMRLFLTKEEHLPFSAGKLLQMLNRRQREARVCQTGVGLRISVGETCCILTHKATCVLAGIYQRSHEMQAEFPCLLDLFAEQASEQMKGMYS